MTDTTPRKPLDALSEQFLAHVMFAASSRRTADELADRIEANLREHGAKLRPEKREDLQAVLVWLRKPGGARTGEA